MENEKETVGTVQGRLEILYKGVISEENSVQYYESLIEKTPGDSEEELGMRRMYADLKQEELQHVERFRVLIKHWEEMLAKLKG
jgi:rubrerythrin